MHRILGARSIRSRSLPVLVGPANSLRPTPYHERISCSYCRKIVGEDQNLGFMMNIRHQSTKTANSIQNPKRKVKLKKHKKYGELLEVSESKMTETQISINKLKADHVTKLASSSFSLNQLHQVTQKKHKSTSTSNSEYVQEIVNKILNDKPQIQNIEFEEDKCALIFTRHNISLVEDKFKDQEYVKKIKESYNKFMKSTMYNQRLKDLNIAINAGLSQEFDFMDDNVAFGTVKGPHAIFKEFVAEYQQSYNMLQDNMLDHLSTYQSRGIAHPALEELYDESNLHTDINEIKKDSETQPLLDVPSVKPVKVKKLKQKQKKQAQKQKREKHMKEDLQDIERRGKEEALNKLLAVHLHLLCSLDMNNQAMQILQHYRSKGAKCEKQSKITDVTVYNILLHGFAAEGKFETVSSLLESMRADGVALSAQSYAAAFECVERSAAPHKLPLLSALARDMAAQGITLNDLIDKSKFVRDQMEVVMTAVRRLEPNFSPTFTPPQLDYICPLLDDIKLDKPENRQGLKVSPIEGMMGLEELKRRVKTQLRNEIEGTIEVENIELRVEPTKAILFCRQKLKETQEEWRQVIREAFLRSVATLKAQSSVSHNAITLYPYLTVLPVEQFVELLMGELNKLIDGSESYSPTLTMLQRDLGTQVYERFKVEQYKRNGVLEKLERMYEVYCEWYLNRQPLDSSGATYNARQAWQTILHQHREGVSLDMEEQQWPIDVKRNVGKFLYNIIVNDVKIDVNMFQGKNAKPKKLPALYRVHRPWGRHYRLELKPHPACVRLCRGAAPASLRMRTPLAPLLAPAAPWTGLASGGYLLQPPALIRMPLNVVQQWKRIEQAPAGSMYPVLDSLNQLGEVPWTINRRILDLQLQVFRSGGSKELDIAQPPSAVDASQFDAGSGKGAAFRRRVMVNRAKAEMYSLWCDALYKLSLANHYRDEVFWLPHNLDFRGRVYACPPHVSQLGADSARALLELAQRRALGAAGLDWLKLHAINLTGAMKKQTLAERLEYANSILDEIVDSAERPLEGRRWWAQSEEPWQTLACCIEIRNAIHSGNPEEYLCGFPVHQDGSCNGLQHYAALGGDEAGATAVNLQALDKPQDVYSAVAALVEEARARDAAAGVAAARALDGFVRRKVIKQTVMTTVYGVTRFGARLQIAKQLKDIDDFPKSQVWACSHYLTTKTFESLGEMFSSTKKIQDWLTDCARGISGVCGESVEWVTPLGLPVVQPYYRHAPDAKPAPGALSSRPALDLNQRPCTVKQKNAFPPNFIHSLDSSHMMLTGLRCQAAGIAFVSVHDCFWTHPHTVAAMNQICREQFVALHSQPILQDLSDFLVQRYSYDKSAIDDDTNAGASKRRINSLLRRVPSKGTFDLKNVLNSVYFFS